MTNTIIAAVYVAGMLLTLAVFRWVGVKPPPHVIIGWPWVIGQIAVRLPGVVIEGCRKAWRETF